MTNLANTETGVQITCAGVKVEVSVQAVVTPEGDWLTLTASTHDSLAGSIANVPDPQDISMSECLAGDRLSLGGTVCDPCTSSIGDDFCLGLVGTTGHCNFDGDDQCDKCTVRPSAMGVGGTCDRDEMYLRPGYWRGNPASTLFVRECSVLATLAGLYNKKHSRVNMTTPIDSLKISKDELREFERRERLDQRGDCGTGSPANLNIESGDVHEIHYPRRYYDARPVEMATADEYFSVCPTARSPERSATARALTTAAPAPAPA